MNPLATVPGKLTGSSPPWPAAASARSTASAPPTPRSTAIPTVASVVRETASAQSAAGPYVFLYAAGYAVGRATALGPSAYADYEGETVTTDLAAGVVAGVIAAFHAPASPCADRNIRC